MAAGQQRKRLASSNLHELKGKKKKKLDSSDYILNLRSHVHLQWDEVQKRVVAKREQIGITWKDLSPYVDSVPKIHSGLADVFSFPKEVFDLDNLMEVLSHEVWLTCLSVSERKLLMQFLPSCAFPEEAVQSLLTGENLHFGNPFLKWSTLLCSSDLHPDVLLQKERHTRVSKKQYNLEINKYHTNMVVVLRMLKEKSETCEDPEKLWRKLSTLNDSSEGSEKPHDYFIQKEELPLKISNRYVDEAKYMSYIKVNKKQFKMLKELKHSGDHIQSKSISHVLGDIKNFHVYPYKLYEDEENNRLREHWMQVAKDTHAAFEKYNKRKFLKMQRMECLEKELAESRTLLHEKAEESVLGNSPDHSIVSTDEEHSRSRSVSAHDHTLERIPSLNSVRELNPSISDQETRNENTLTPAKNTLSPSQSVDKMDSSQMVEELKALISPLKSTWISTSCEDSSYQKPSQTHLFASSDVPLNQCQHFQVQAAPIINLEREGMEQVAGRLLPSSFSVGTTSQLFGSYIQSHDEVIPTFPMASDILSSHMNELSQPGLQLLINDGNLRETDRFPLLEDNQQTINERHSCEKELYLQSMIDKNFCNKIRYENQLGYYPSSSSRCTLQSCVTDRLGRQNWFPNEHQPHNVWSGIDSSGSGVQSGSGDGSLFSVLPEFRNLPFRSSFDAAGSDQLLRPPNYIGMSMAEPFIPTQVSSSTGLTSAPIPSVDLMRVNYTHQNPPSLQESAMKPFMRHWHQ
ncbi:hypothetical protein KFK09_012081 [Dendrobium nobile]|uniref:DEUBAD domain-containing protein n=1 Tax=Dendrobium nobile TaxID=94219 RepID=A0A8T3BHT3_DENNO|nr:hypothetical protein KFK09_012081 [Dendrobium nobile]